MQQLNKYDNRSYRTGAGFAKRAIWYCINAIIFDSWFLPLPKPKVYLLEMFGANVGDMVNIKPRVNIKYPWNLEIGSNVWLGEGVWIDNLAKVTINDNVCISQGAYLLTGNHDYKKETFDLITSGITINSGVWIGAKVIVCPGVEIFENAVITVGSVISKDVKENSIYRCAHAEFFKYRI